jgi:hypothetical protein
MAVEGLHCKRPIPICRLFFKIDLLTDIAALCLTDFIDLRYIHSLVSIFDPACELLPPWTKELYLCTELVNCCPDGRRNYTCVLLPLYLLSYLLPPSQTKCTELEFVKSLWGLGTEKEECYRTSPPGYIGWLNSFLGIDSGAPYTFKNMGSIYTDSVCLGGGSEWCCVDHILQEFYTRFLTRCRTYQITSPPPLKTTERGWCL